MRRPRLRKLSGSEIDAFSRARHFLGWGRGTLAYIKRTHSKRVRRAAKREIADANDQISN